MFAGKTFVHLPLCHPRFQLASKEIRLAFVGEKK